MRAMAAKGATMPSSSILIGGVGRLGSAITVKSGFILLAIDPPVPLGQSKAESSPRSGPSTNLPGGSLASPRLRYAAVGSAKQKRAPPSWRFSAQIMP